MGFGEKNWKLEIWTNNGRKPGIWWLMLIHEVKEVKYYDGTMRLSPFAR